MTELVRNHEKSKKLESKSKVYEKVKHQRTRKTKPPSGPIKNCKRNETESKAC